MRAPPLTSMLLTLLALPVHAAEPSVVLPVQKPSDALLKQVIESHELSFGSGEWLWSFDANGVVNASRHDESPGSWATDCECRGSWSISAATLRVACKEAQCTKAYSRMFGAKPSETWTESASLSVRFLHVSPQATLFVNEGKRWLSAPCSPPFPANPRCARTEPTDRLLVQLTPGAKDTTLFNAVKTAIDARPPTDGRFVFEGAPASKPRDVSEVLFTAGNETEAKRLAEALEPVIGKVQVKPWPGDWDFGVVVVVGAKKAP